MIAAHSVIALLSRQLKGVLKLCCAAFYCFEIFREKKLTLENIGKSLAKM